MNTKKRLLTELDLKHVSKLISRDPNNSELDLIENVLSFELQNRDYLEVISRLNKGANRKASITSNNNESNSLCFINGLRIYNANKLIFDQDESNSKVQLNKVLPLLNSNSYIANEYDLKFINKEIYSAKKLSVLQFKSDETCSDQIIFTSLIGINNEASETIINNHSEYATYEIIIGKNTKKNDKYASEFIKTGLKNEWFASINKISNRGIGNTLIQELYSINCGIDLDNDLPINYLINHKKTTSFLVTVNQQNSTKIESYCKENDLTFIIIGKLLKEPIIQLVNSEDATISLPMEVFDLQYDVNTRHFKEPEITVYKSSENITGVKKLSLSNQLIKLFEKILVNNFNSINNQRIISNYGHSVYASEFASLIVIAQADNNNLLHISPRISAKIVVANAVRKLSCLGVKPKYLQVHNLFPSESPLTANWKASEILQGQEEAIRELDLRIANRKIDVFDNYWEQNVLAIGLLKNIKMPDISFKNDGDFISLLGSHRGELGGTEYQRYISDKIESTIPTLDLNMEKRVQDVVQQGISTNLLKSATNVSLGGISIAIAMSLAASESGVGARIHLSRKLTNEELLFGETQGLVIVTLSEEDIMEFERICMTVGVPSTTIGRVTNTNDYSFNDLINLNVDKIRKIIS